MVKEKEAIKKYFSIASFRRINSRVVGVDCESVSRSIQIYSEVCPFFLRRSQPKSPPEVVIARRANEEGSGTPTANLKTPVPEMSPRVL